MKCISNKHTAYIGAWGISGLISAVHMILALPVALWEIRRSAW